MWESTFNPAPYDAHMRILAHVRSGARVLDVGCNTGQLGEQLQVRLHCHVVGVEVNPEAAARAARRVQEVICCDVDQLPVFYPPTDTALFDCIVAADVLEHLPNPWQTLRMLTHYLKPGGQVVVSLPNVANYAIRLALLGGNFDYGGNQIVTHGHLAFFTLKSAQQLLHGAGLHVQTVDVSPGLFLFKPYHLTLERIFGRWMCYRHLEYRVSKFWKNLCAFQFILVAIKPPQEGIL